MANHNEVEQEKNQMADISEKGAWKRIEKDPTQALGVYMEVKARNREIDRYNLYPDNKDKRWMTMALARVGILIRREIGSEEPTFKSIPNEPGGVFYKLNPDPPAGALDRLFELAHYKPKDSQE